MTTIAEGISAAADDGTERVDNSSWGAASSTAYWGYTYFTRYGGLRFQTLNVPQGVTIDSATITLQIESKSGTVTGTWWGDDVDDAAAWGASDRPSQITQTTANASFVEAASGDAVQTVTSIVQEIVNRGGWAANQDMRFSAFFPTTLTNNIKVYMLDHYSGTKDAEISITYSAGGPSKPPALTLLGVG